MRKEIIVDKLGEPVYNRVLIRVIDTFETFMSKGGIQLVNLTHEESWADSKEYNITEFVPRHGIVVTLPRKVTRGSFDYDTLNELQVGDMVYWSSISFKEHIPLVYNDEKYLLVDYHDIVVRIRYGEMVPINGFGLFKSVPKTETVLAYSKQ